MNRFGPTQAATTQALDLAVSSWMAGRHTHIDTIMQLQAAGMDFRMIAEHEPTPTRKNQHHVVDAESMDALELELRVLATVLKDYDVDALLNSLVTDDEIINNETTP